MSRQPSVFDDESRPVVPDGMTVRRRRRRRSWSRRDLVNAVSRASERATGIAESISPTLLQGIEEENEPVPYAVLCLLAGGLDCEPIELLLSEELPTPEEEEAEPRLERDRKPEGRAARRSRAESSG